MIKEYPNYSKYADGYISRINEFTKYVYENYFELFIFKDAYDSCLNLDPSRPEILHILEEENLIEYIFPPEAELLKLTEKGRIVAKLGFKGYLLRSFNI